MAKLFGHIHEYFTQPKRPDISFQITARYLSGIWVSQKDRKIKSHFFLPLHRGVVEPSFDRKNIKNLPELEKRLREGSARFQGSGNTVGCLVPESCLKVLVFTFDALPASSKERERLIRWRVNKQVPVLPEDTRLSYDVCGEGGSMRVIVSLARSSVIQEYEEAWLRLGFKVRAVGVASLNLINVLDIQKDDDLLVANLEEEQISLMAVINSRVVLYRLKPFMLDSASDLPLEQKVDNIVQEIENTVHFIEDREKKSVCSLWLRVALVEGGRELSSALKARIGYPVREIASAVESVMSMEERSILSPLIGQAL